MTKLSESSTKSSLLNLDHLISASVSSTDTSAESTENSQLKDIESTIINVAELSLKDVIPNEDAIISQESKLAVSF